MAFVSCGDFKTSQADQDEEIAKLKKEVEALQNAEPPTFESIDAENSLLDKSGGGPGIITAEKIKEALGGKVKVITENGSGLIGDGTEGNPLGIKTVRLVDASGTHHLGNIIGVSNERNS